MTTKKTLHDLQLKALFKFDYDLNSVYKLVALSDDGNNASVVRVAGKPDGTYYEPITGSIGGGLENANPYCEVIEVLLTFTPV